VRNTYHGDRYDTVNGHKLIITQFISIGIFMLHSGRLYSHDFAGLATGFSGNHGIPAEFSSDARHALGRANSKR
jgi:hypothetical protein